MKATKKLTQMTRCELAELRRKGGLMADAAERELGRRDAEEDAEREAEAGRYAAERFACQVAA